MKKINNKLRLLTIIGMFVSASTSAQTDSTFMKQQIKLTTDSMLHSFSQKDWNGFTYFIYPDLIKVIGTKEEFATFVQEQMAALETAQIDTMLTGNILQLIKKNDQWQCLVQNYMQMHVEGLLVSGVSNNIGFSNDEGKSWKYIRIEEGAEETIRKLFPLISKEFNIPHGKTAFNTTIEELIKTYTPVYPDTK